MSTEIGIRRLIQYNQKESDMTEKVTLMMLFEAIRRVETGGKPKKGKGALSEDGKRLGPFQISEEYYRESRVGFPYELCAEAGPSMITMMGYFLRFRAQALREDDIQALARVHAGGPRGHLRKDTLVYWEKVLSALAEISQEKAQGEIRWTCL